MAEELPLEKVEMDQGYIHYRKGSLVMYRLADEIGEDAVNPRPALDALAKYGAFKGAPYPTALDLVRGAAAPRRGRTGNSVDHRPVRENHAL